MGQPQAHSLGLVHTLFPILHHILIAPRGRAAITQTPPGAGTLALRTSVISARHMNLLVYAGPADYPYRLVPGPRLALARIGLSCYLTYVVNPFRPSF